MISLFKASFFRDISEMYLEQKDVSGMQKSIIIDIIILSQKGSTKLSRYGAGTYMYHLDEA